MAFEVVALLLRRGGGHFAFIARQPSQSAGGARRRKSRLRAIAGVLLLGSLAKGAVMCFFFALAVFSCLVYASLVGHGSSSKELGNQRLWLSHHDASPRTVSLNRLAGPPSPHTPSRRRPLSFIYYLLCFELGRLAPSRRGVCVTERPRPPYTVGPSVRSEATMAIVY